MLAISRIGSPLSHRRIASFIYSGQLRLAPIFTPRVLARAADHSTAQVKK